MTRRCRADVAKQRYGPWAVVTGASDGIGREFARRLSESGVNVVLAARRQQRLEALATELMAAHRVQTEIIVTDLSKRAGVELLLKSTRPLDVGLFVACAGYGTSGNFLDAALDDELTMIDVNCRAVVSLAHAYGSRFARRGRGGLVFMSSLLAFQGVPRAASYAATKAFVQTFAEGLRDELRPFGVDVIASAPGPVHSGFADRARMTMALAADAPLVARQTLAALGDRTTVRPGWLSKGLEGSLKLLPRAGRVRVMRSVMAGMTKKD